MYRELVLLYTAMTAPIPLLKHFGYMYQNHLDVLNTYGSISTAGNLA